jgi:acetyl-CoA carboxylase biotin carboxyl carrier protein
MAETKKTSSGNGIDVGFVEAVANLLSSANVSEIEIEKGDLRIRVSRAAPVMAVPPQAPYNFQLPSLAGPIPSASPAPAPAAEAPAAADLSKHPGAVKSPMVGTAYASPQPGAAAFVKPGDTVAEGQTLLIVEAMKTMNAIPAPRAGKVAQILFQDAQPVEYGQVLLILE